MDQGGLVALLRRVTRGPGFPPSGCCVIPVVVLSTWLKLPPSVHIAAPWDRGPGGGGPIPTAHVPAATALSHDSTELQGRRPGGVLVSWVPPVGPDP